MPTKREIDTKKVQVLRCHPRSEVRVQYSQISFGLRGFIHIEPLHGCSRNDGPMSRVLFVSWMAFRTTNCVQIFCIVLIPLGFNCVYVLVCVTC